MKRVYIIAVFLCLFSAPLLAQDTPQEIAEKLNKAHRAAAMKMFPDLEKRNLLGVEDERVDKDRNSRIREYREGG